MMASSSTQPDAAENKLILTPAMFLEGHESWKYYSPNGEHYERKRVSSISYFPDGKQMISGSCDQTVRRWDLREGKEIKEARKVYEDFINKVRLSRDGRWVVTATSSELKVSEVETGIVRTFHGLPTFICIDISADSALVAGGSSDETRIWSLDTGELVAGPFKTSTGNRVLTTSVRFSEDSRKLAVLLEWGTYLQVWDVQAQKLLVEKSAPSKPGVFGPVFWTTKDKSIVTAFRFIDDPPTGTTYDPSSTIYELDPSTLKIVGAPFKHTSAIVDLALSSDFVLLVSASSYDNTIKMWAFQSRQLLASFNFDSPRTLALSPDSRQLAYTSSEDTKIYVCNIPANILASIRLEEPQPGASKSERSCHAGLLNSDATPRPVRRKLMIPAVSPVPRPSMPARDPHARLRFLRKLFSSSFRTNAVRTDEPRNPLDFPATSPLPHSLVTPDENSRSTPASPVTHSSAINTSATLQSSLHRLSTWWPFQTDHALPTIVDVSLAPGRLRYAAAGAPAHDDDDLIRDEDYVSPPSPNPSSRPGIVNSGQHGRDRFCFCF